MELYNMPPTTNPTQGTMARDSRRAGLFAESDEPWQSFHCCSPWGHHLFSGTRAAGSQKWVYLGIYSTYKKGSMPLEIPTLQGGRWLQESLRRNLWSVRNGGYYFITSKTTMQMRESIRNQLADGRGALTIAACMCMCRCRQRSTLVCNWQHAGGARFTCFLI